MSDKHKQNKTDSQEFTEALALQIASRMVISKGKICFSDDLDSPLEVLAQGPAGRDGRIGDCGLPGKDGVDGADGATGPRGPAGRDGVDGAVGPMGPAGPKGEVSYPVMNWDGTKLSVGKHNGVDLQGPAGADGVGIQGKTGPMGPAGQNAPPAMLPEEVVDILQRLERLEAIQ